MDTGFKARQIYVLLTDSLLLALAYWAGYFISLNLNFFIHEIGKIIPL